MNGGHWKDLFKAACNGDLGLVQHHVRQGVDIDDAHPAFLSTPLVACALAGQQAVALFLLDAGANPHLRSGFDGMTLAQAARRAGLPVLKARLVQLGATPPAAAGRCPVHPQP